MCRWAQIISVGALLLGVVAGCGSSTAKPAGSGTPAQVVEPRPSSGAASVSEFVSRADAVCAKTDAQAKTLVSSNALQSGHYASFYEQLLTIERERELALSAIVPPSARSAEYAKLLGLLQQESQHVAEGEQATLGHESEREQRLDKEGETEGAPIARLESALGLKVCTGPIV